MIKIYALRDPRDGSAFYVGQTINTKQRLMAHVSSARRGEIGSKAEQIRDILAIGAEVALEILEQTDGPAGPLEKKWTEKLGTLTAGNNHGSGRPAGTIRREKSEVIFVRIPVSIGAEFDRHAAAAGETRRARIRSLIFADIEDRITIVPCALGHSCPRCNGGAM